MAAVTTWTLLPACNSSSKREAP